MKTSSPPVYRLSSNLRQRWTNLYPVSCFECGTFLPLNPSPDEFLICVNCNTKYDLLDVRLSSSCEQPLTLLRYGTVTQLGPYGRLHRRRLSVTALSQGELPF